MLVSTGNHSITQGDILTTPELPNHPPVNPQQREETQVLPASEPSDRDPAAAPTPAARKPVNKTLLIGAASFIVGALLGIAGTAATISTVNDANTKSAAEAAAKAEADKPHILKSAASDCGITNSDGAKLGDNDTSLSLDGKGTEDYSGLSMTSINCVMDAIKVPDYIRQQMNKTRALDGTQRESWNNISATWSYHPNTGFNLGLTEKR